MPGVNGIYLVANQRAEADLFNRKWSVLVLSLIAQRGIGAAAGLILSRLEEPACASSPMILVRQHEKTFCAAWVLL